MKTPHPRQHGLIKQGRLTPQEYARAVAQASAPGGPCHHAPTACPICGTDLAGALERACDGWNDLWRGTLGVLTRQEPRAYRRLLATWARHGLVGYVFKAARVVTEQEMPRYSLMEQEMIRRDQARRDREARVNTLKQTLGREFRSRDGRWLVGQFPEPPHGPSVGFRSTDAILAKYRAFAQDRQPARLTGTVKPRPPARLIYRAYRRARRHLRGQPARRGDTLESRALMLIRERMFTDYTEETLRQLMKRGRREVSSDPATDAWMDAPLGLSRPAAPPSPS